MAGTQESLLNGAVDNFKVAQANLVAANKRSTNDERKAAERAYQTAERCMKSRYAEYQENLKERALTLPVYCKQRGVTYSS